jgi:hypothetical protein
MFSTPGGESAACWGSEDGISPPACGTHSPQWAGSVFLCGTPVAGPPAYCRPASEGLSVQIHPV